MNKVKSIADDDQGKLVRKLLLLQKVFHAFRLVAAALAANALNFFDLVSFAGSLNVFEVNLGVLAEVDDRPQEIIKA